MSVIARLSIKFELDVLHLVESDDRGNHREITTGLGACDGRGHADLIITTTLVFGRCATPNDIYKFPENFHLLLHKQVLHDSKINHSWTLGVSFFISPSLWESTRGNKPFLVYIRF